MSSNPLRALSVSFTIATVLLAGTGFAKEPVATPMEVIDFKDADKVTTSGVSPDNNVVKDRKGIVRTLITRPRVQFVVELMRTIEQL